MSQLPEPGNDPASFRQSVARDFGIEGKIGRIEHLVEALAKQDSDGGGCKRLLIIDEAQRLVPELQAELLQLAQLGQAQSRRIHILLVGQNELYQWLTGPNREAFIKEVSATCKVHPLRETETAAYIDHRLHIANAGRSPFTPDAIREIHNFSQGVPRTINLICDHSLLHAHLKNLDEIDARTVAVCKDRFQIASLPDAATTGTEGHDLSPVVSEPPPRSLSISRRILPRTAVLLLLLIVAGFYFHYDSSRRPQMTNTAGVLEPSPPEAVLPIARPEAPLPAQPASPNTRPPVDRVNQPLRPPAETVNTEPPPADLNPTAADPPPVIKPPEERDGSAVEPSTDRQVVTTSARALSLQSPPPPEAESAEDTDKPENLEIDDDPGAIIDWLIQENRKEQAAD